MKKKIKIGFVVLVFIVVAYVGCLFTGISQRRKRKVFRLRR